jgi:hypothetical protein
MRFEVLMAVKMPVMAFCKLCGFVGGYERFGEISASIFMADITVFLRLRFLKVIKWCIGIK